jgi:hypothetical protein
MQNVKIVNETACIMYKHNDQVKKAFFINQMTFKYFTEQQLQKLEKRLSNEKVYPVKLYMGNYSDSLYLLCKNNDFSPYPENFTFCINTKGYEKGLGYDYEKHIDHNFTLLVDFMENM